MRFDENAAVPGETRVHPRVPACGVGARLCRLLAAWLLLTAALALPAAAQGEEVPDYSVERMRQLNPDFTTYPDVQGIVWLRREVFGRGDKGGMERTHLWVILGRRGLDDRWLTWRIPDPAGGRAEVLQACVYSFDTGEKLRDVTPTVEGGLQTVSFRDLPEPFILAIAWRDVAPDALAFEDLVWLQESLPVWESNVEVHLLPSQSVVFRAFPQELEPEVRRTPQEAVYSWRVINAAPFESKGLVRSRRSGLAFSMRRERAGLIRLMRSDAGELPNAPDAARAGFRRSAEEGVKGLLNWLFLQPELHLPDGTRRKVPDAAPWTRNEKLLLAKAWLAQEGVDAPMRWRLPVEPEEEPPLSRELLQDALLELPAFHGKQRTRDSVFYDMSAPFDGGSSVSLQGERVFGLSVDGSLSRKEVPVSRAAANRLFAAMELKMDEQGRLTGAVRLLLRGAWISFLLPQQSPAETEARAALLELFPDLRHYEDVQCRRSGEGLELSFALKEKPGVAGIGGSGLLAVPPAFLPKAFSALGGQSGPLELRFPFVLEQRWTIGLPRSAERILDEGETKRTPDRINYSDSCKAWRHRVVGSARCEVDTLRVAEGDLALLRRCVGLWKAFAERHIPVQLKR